jgi:vacuolar-type H+-ATPase subunit E/Vma4
MLELLEAHPFTQKLREEREAEILQVRKEAGGRLARLKEEAARVLPELQATEDMAREAVKAHDKQRRELEGAIARAAAARAEERLRLEREATAALDSKLDDMAGTTDYLLGKLNKKFSELMGRPRK